MDGLGTVEGGWLWTDPQLLRAGARHAGDLATAHELCIRHVGGAVATSSEWWSSPAGAGFRELLERMIGALRQRVDHGRTTAGVLNTHANRLEEVRARHRALHGRLDEVVARLQELEPVAGNLVGTAIQGELERLDEEATRCRAELAWIGEEAARV